MTAGRLLLALLVLIVAAPAPAATPREQVLRAGHLLRHLGFGPNRRERHAVLRMGEAAYIEQQLQPETIDDRIGERRFHREPTAVDGGEVWIYRWFSAVYATVLEKHLGAPIRVRSSAAISERWLFCRPD